MEVESPRRAHDPLHQSDRERSERAEEVLWSSLGSLYRWRRFIFGVTGAVAVMAVVISLLLPKWYLASARVLPPETSIGGLAGVLGNIPPAAAGLFSGSRAANYTRYLAILSSRSVMESVVERFRLEEVYETTRSSTSREDALRTLQGNVDFVIDRRYGYLAVDVFDQEPERAAAMANFFVEELNRIHTELSAQTASRYRHYVEQRYQKAEADMETVRAAMQQFQEQHGVIELNAQAEAFLMAMAELRGSAIQAEIQLESLLQQYGPGNAQVEAYRSTVQAAQHKINALLSGQDRLMPIAQHEMPLAARRYAELMQNVLIQTEIIKLVRPLYEQALFEEQKDMLAVQVLDAAVPPVKKAWPKRAIIVITAVLSAFVLAIVFVFLYEWWQRNHAYFARHMQERLYPSA